MFVRKRKFDEVEEEDFTKQKWNVTKEEAALEVADYMMQQSGANGSIGDEPRSYFKQFCKTVEISNEKYDDAIPGEYHVPTPGFSRLENESVIHDLKVMLPHELLAGELATYDVAAK
eukprot:6492363-Amphidinium_carterae.1